LKHTAGYSGFWQGLRWKIMVAKYHCDVLDVLLFGFPPKNPEMMKKRSMHVTKA